MALLQDGRSTKPDCCRGCPGSSGERVFFRFVLEIPRCTTAVITDAVSSFPVLGSRRLARTSGRLRAPLTFQNSMHGAHDPELGNNNSPEAAALGSYATPL
jgi:hypothetical protein